MRELLGHWRYAKAWACQTYAVTRQALDLYLGASAHLDLGVILPLGYHTLCCTV